MFNVLYMFPSFLSGIRKHVARTQFNLIHLIFLSHLIFLEVIKSDNFSIH